MFKNIELCWLQLGSSMFLRLCAETIGTDSVFKAVTSVYGSLLCFCLLAKTCAKSAEKIEKYSKYTRSKALVFLFL